MNKFAISTNSVPGNSQLYRRPSLRATVAAFEGIDIFFCPLIAQLQIA